VIILEDEQGSEAWRRSRLGCPSASAFSKLITRTGKPSTQSVGYVNQLIAEKLSGELTEHHTSEAMVRGTEMEPLARENYEFLTDNTVNEYGFITNDAGEYGCSPDGLIGEEGGLEIKCPLGATQVKYMRDPQELVKQYWQQIQGCMWVTDRKWWDAFAFHPLLDHVLVRVERDEEYIKKLAKEVQEAVNIINLEVEKNK